MNEDEVISLCVEHNIIMINKTIHLSDDKVVKIMVVAKGNLDEQKKIMF